MANERVDTDARKLLKTYMTRFSGASGELDDMIPLIDEVVASKLKNDSQHQRVLNILLAFYQCRSESSFIGDVEHEYIEDIETKLVGHTFRDQSVQVPAVADASNSDDTLNIPICIIKKKLLIDDHEIELFLTAYRNSAHFHIIRLLGVNDNASSVWPDSGPEVNYPNVDDVLMRYSAEPTTGSDIKVNSATDRAIVANAHARFINIKMFESINTNWNNKIRDELTLDMLSMQSQNKQDQDNLQHKQVKAHLNNNITTNEVAIFNKMGEIIKLLGDEVNINITYEQFHQIADKLPLLIDGHAGTGKSIILAFRVVVKLMHVYETNGIEHIRELQLLVMAYNNQVLSMIERCVEEWLKVMLEEHEPEVIDVLCSAIQYSTIRSKMFSLFSPGRRNKLPNPNSTQFRSRFVSFSRFQNEFFINRKKTLAPNLSAEQSWYFIKAITKGQGLGAAFKQTLRLENFNTVGRTDGFVDRKFTLGMSDDEIIQGISVQDSYEIWRKDNNYLDDLDIARLAFLDLSEGFRLDEISVYDEIFVDEAQDLTHYEYDIFVRFLKDSSQSENINVFPPIAISGDPLQTISPTGFSWKIIKALITKLQIDILGQKQSLNPTRMTASHRMPISAVAVANVIVDLRNGYKTLIDGENLAPMTSYSGGRSGQITLVPFDEEDSEQSKLMSRFFLDSLDRSIGILAWAKDSIDLEILHNNDRVLSSLKEESSGIIQESHNVFSIESVKGLEFDTVILYRFFSGGISAIDTFNSIIKAQGDVDSTKLEDRYKQLYFLNRFFVSLTRHRKHLVIIDDEDSLSQFWNHGVWNHSIDSIKNFHKDLKRSLDDILEELEPSLEAARELLEKARLKDYNRELLQRALVAAQAVSFESKEKRELVRKVNLILINQDIEEAIHKDDKKEEMKSREKRKRLRNEDPYDIENITDSVEIGDWEEVKNWIGWENQNNLSIKHTHAKELANFSPEKIEIADIKKLVSVQQKIARNPSVELGSFIHACRNRLVSCIKNFLAICEVDEVIEFINKVRMKEIGMSSESVINDVIAMRGAMREKYGWGIGRFHELFREGLHINDSKKNRIRALIAQKIAEFEEWEEFVEKYDENNERDKGSTYKELIFIMNEEGLSENVIIKRIRKRIELMCSIDNIFTDKSIIDERGSKSTPAQIANRIIVDLKEYGYDKHSDLRRLFSILSTIYAYVYATAGEGIRWRRKLKDFDKLLDIENFTSKNLGQSIGTAKVVSGLNNLLVGEESILYSCIHKLCTKTWRSERWRVRIDPVNIIHDDVIAKMILRVVVYLGDEKSAAEWLSNLLVSNINEIKNSSESELNALFTILKFVLEQKGCWRSNIVEKIVVTILTHDGMTKRSPSIEAMNHTINSFELLTKLDVENSKKLEKVIDMRNTYDRLEGTTPQKRNIAKQIMREHGMNNALKSIQVHEEEGEGVRELLNSLRSDNRSKLDMVLANHYSDGNWEENDKVLSKALNYILGEDSKPAEVNELVHRALLPISKYNVRPDILNKAAGKTESGDIRFILLGTMVGYRKSHPSISNRVRKSITTQLSRQTSIWEAVNNNQNILRIRDIHMYQEDKESHELFDALLAFSEWAFRSLSLTVPIFEEWSNNFGEKINGSRGNYPELLTNHDYFSDEYISMNSKIHDNLEDIRHVFAINHKPNKEAWVDIA